jgi:predicted RNA-binding Zn-ribbon protein involved in translation (DUF1610 family)
MTQKWIKSSKLEGYEDFTCPRCKRPTELLVDAAYVHAERCTRCGWQVSFDTTNGDTEKEDLE